MKLKKILIIFFLCLVECLHAQSVAWYENIGSRSRFSESNYISIVKIESDSQFVYVLGTCNRMPIQFQQNKVALEGLYYGGDAFIAQFTHKGHLNWVQKLGIDAFSGGYHNHIMALHKGNIYVSGAFYNMALVGQDTLRGNNSNIYLAKIDKNGRKIWHKTASPTYYLNDIEPKKMVFDKEDRIYLAGEIRPVRPLIFDSLSTSVGSRQFICKFDNIGTPLAVLSLKEQYGGGHGLHVADLQLDTKNNLLLLMSSGDYYTTGTCFSTVALTRLYRISPQWKIDSIATFHSNNMVTGTTLSIIENGDMYIGGRYSGQLGINGLQSESTNCANMNAFLARLTANGRLIWLKTGNSSELSEIIKVIPEKDGNLLMMGVQNYEKGKSNNRFRVLGYPRPYPNGETRYFIKRLNAFGAALDSVEFYMQLSRDYGRPTMDFTQNPQGNLFFGIDYDCKLDTFSHTLCYESNWNPMDSTSEVYGSKLFVARLGDLMLQKRQLSSPITENQFQIFPNPTADWIYVQSQTPIPTQTTAILYDINGRMVQQVIYDDKKLFIEMNVANQPAGIYILVLRNNGTFLSSTKIIKL